MKKTADDGLRELATGCVQRLLEIGLPEKQAVLALDVVRAHIENYADRLTSGEWA